VGLPEGEAAVEVVLAPVVCLRGHPGDRPQGKGHDPPRQERRDDQQHTDHDQRGSQRNVLGVLVRDEGQPRDHRA
jgi:hypothetical protein